MADTTTTSPGDMDPLQQASLAGAWVNVKSFADAQVQMLNVGIQNMLANQQAWQSRTLAQQTEADQFNKMLMGKIASTVLDPSSNALADAIVGGQGVKAFQSTPPVYTDPSSSIAALAAQIAALTQFVQGLNIAPATK